MRFHIKQLIKVLIGFLVGASLYYLINFLYNLYLFNYKPK